MAKLVNALKHQEATTTNLPLLPLDPEIENMRRKVELINKGFIVHIANVESIKEGDNYMTLKITLLSEVNRMPVFGDVELKITKQAIPRLKSELAKVG